MTDLHAHECSCGPEDRCVSCGCCQHCDNTCLTLCRITELPAGFKCPSSDCGCEGKA